MKDSFFRAYDMRGIVGTECILEEFEQLGYAIAAYFKDKDASITTVVIGRDGREHSECIQNNIIKALNNSGFSIIDIGLCSTPMIYFSEYRLPVQAGIMITASHNPKEYNGIKITCHKQSVSAQEIQMIKQYYYDKKRITSHIYGTYTLYDMLTEYVAYLTRLFPHLHARKDQWIFDCGNGAAGPIMERLKTAFDWKNVTLLYSNIDGTYPHHSADPTDSKNMQDLMQHLILQDVDFGIGFDGDADRMGVITKHGTMVTGEMLLAAWTRSLAHDHPGASVVYDLKCSDALTDVIMQYGLYPVQVAVGHTHIKSALHAYQAILGGELSCHFFFKDRYFGFDDGIYAALRLLELITTYTMSIDEIIELFPFRYRSPEFRIACTYNGVSVIEHVKQYCMRYPQYRLKTLDGIRLETEYGWFLIRASNTQPVLSLRFEARVQSELEALKDISSAALEPFITKENFIKQVTW